MSCLVCMSCAPWCALYVLRSALPTSTRSSTPHLRSAKLVQAQQGRALPIIRHVSCCTCSKGHLQKVRRAGEGFALGCFACSRRSSTPHLRIAKLVQAQQGRAWAAQIRRCSKSVHACPSSGLPPAAPALKATCKRFAEQAKVLRWACKRFAEQAKVLRWAVVPAKGSPSRQRFCAGLLCLQKVRRAGEGFARGCFACADLSFQARTCCRSSRCHCPQTRFPDCCPFCSFWPPCPCWFFSSCCP
jgi:hypothetical protein